ncbi:5-formyltetrahydrofolate cyclo-ligase [Candidatus Schneideria nysicola]|uniref:5-formyltetrahydrofolate cyclo-ligase n=1 Tax=Candidatus Schneideria nysicola TaxID=1081631 RepID=UPI001CAA620F|nr:5-formyltetrahydrofolate cyclo-ligase [Candidatus Schneideria nysicola]UAJ65642.1 5-formyltetrahydrofolate cyclo-ligase [Candidatus Schneideria nysicola]UAJ66170.1 5-formyltetrahydrofolate cyclo-ligase [Candidatus Schneideria nysicola]
MIHKSLMKDKIRKKIMAHRSTITYEEKYYAAVNIVKKIVEDKRLESAKNFSIFFSYKSELNTYKLIQYFWKNNKKVYLPVLHPFTENHLIFLEYTIFTTLIKNKYNVYEPQLNVRKIIPLEKLDVIFIPLVAFNSQGYRIGMGGGFYDRILYWKYKKNMKMLPIGLAYDFQLIEKSDFPIEDWDIPLPEIITPSHHWIFNKIHK